MPKIATEKPTKRKKKAPVKDRPVVHPQLAAVEAWGDNALTVEKIKEILGWEEETDNVKFGPDYHLVDRDGKKVRLKNSTRNREFRMALCETYVQEHLNKRWHVNGEARVIGKHGEVISGQHSMSAVVLAEQDRQANPHWQENWPGPVTMSTFVSVGVEEADDVVNTVDTGKPRTLADTLYRSEHFADLPPKERAKAARTCDWAIRLVQLRIGVQDAFNPRRSHGASLEFLANHITLRKVVRHIIEEDKAGAITSIITPGYASALTYLMAACNTDPSQYILKIREGDRREKYLDLSSLSKAMEFWTKVGKEGDPALVAVRERLASYAKRKDSLGEEIPVSLDEKIAILALAWKSFLADEVPTMAMVTPRYHKAKDDDSPPLMKDPPKFGGVDLGDDHDDVDVEEDEDDGGVTPEELAKTRPERVQKLIELRKQEAKDKRAETADAKTPGSNGKPQSVAEEIREKYRATAVGHEGKTLFFKSRTSGDLTCIDDDARKVSKILGTPATGDPNGFTRYTISRSKVTEQLPKLYEEGLKIAIAEEVPSGMKNKEVRVKDWTLE